MDGRRLMEFYSDDRKLGPFLPIIRDSPVYPVIKDAAGRVMSLPPIINSDRSKISLQTTDVFIEATATDKTKARVVLNTLVAAFSQHTIQPFCVEPVTVQYLDGDLATGAVKEEVVTPDLSEATFSVESAYVNSSLGLDLSAAEMATLLTKMSLRAEPQTDGSLAVACPITRPDIMHACDIMEDVAVAYGIDNLPAELPAELTVARPLPINKFTDLVRDELALAGYSEVLTFALCAAADVYERLNRPADGLAVELANPKTADFQVVRTTLLSGLLKTVAHQKSAPRPLRLFEVSDVTFVDETRDTTARNERRAAAIFSGVTDGFDVMHGLVQYMTGKLGAPNAEVREASDALATEMLSFLPGRVGEIAVNGTVVGLFGVVHPKVLTAYGITYPCSAFEINLEHFL
jgi:phenylalanyl-tRNA synthetase beta chain